MSDEPIVDGAEVAPRPKRKHTQGQLRLKKRNNDALQMYLAGATLEHIQQTLGWKTRSSAHRAIKKALAEQVQLSPEEMEEQRLKMLAQLDSLGRAHWLNAMRGDRSATDLTLRILDRKAKLMGLDSPEKAGEAVGSAIDREIAALLSSLPTGDGPPALSPVEEP